VQSNSRAAFQKPDALKLLLTPIDAPIWSME
jgi:hypothetical protein